MEFTKQQLKDWQAFERVRSKGTYNMFDPRARAATGLERDEFLFVMSNYSKLASAVAEAAIERKLK